MRTRAFRYCIGEKGTRKEKIVAVLVFGAMGIIGTYSGVGIQGAIANFRAVGPVIGGLLGGPLVGLGAGILAGGHRMLLGGFTGFSCGLATILEAFLAGCFAKKYGFKRIDWKTAFIVGILAESLQMSLILLLARPFSAAWELVKIIAIPMTLTNATGIAIFITIVHNIRLEQERVIALQTRKILEIANRTLPHLKKGLNMESAAYAAQIVYELANVDAVAITDETKILSHVGTESEHHKSGLPVMTEATRSALKGEETIVKTKAEISCDHTGCRLAAGAIVPLKQGERIIGTLKLYRVRENSISDMDIILARGLSEFFSTQLELSELERRARLVSNAEIRALQAQINPHFLFNALNTINTYCRTDPDLARKLLLKLASYFRRNLAEADKFVTVATEIEHIKSYLSIEKARFGEKLNVIFKIDESLLNVLIPPFILQPLVENAVRHGLLPKRHGGRINVTVIKEQNDAVFTVTDDGVGMSADRLKRLFDEKSVESENGLGIALSNVNSRLCSLYGKEYALRIESILKRGTTVTLKIPYIVEVKVS
jgi:two-component system sensor histidine kinase LytS